MNLSEVEGGWSFLHNLFVCSDEYMIEGDVGAG